MGWETKRYLILSVIALAVGGGGLGADDRRASPAAREEDGLVVEIVKSVVPPPAVAAEKEKSVARQQAEKSSEILSTTSSKTREEEGRPIAVIPVALDRDREEIGNASEWDSDSSRQASQPKSAPAHPKKTPSRPHNEISANPPSPSPPSSSGKVGPASEENHEMASEAQASSARKRDEKEGMPIPVIPMDEEGHAAYLAKNAASFLPRVETPVTLPYPTRFHEVLKKGHAQSLASESEVAILPVAKGDEASATSLPASQTDATASAPTLPPEEERYFSGGPATTSMNQNQVRLIRVPSLSPQRSSFLDRNLFLQIPSPSELAELAWRE